MSLKNPPINLEWKEKRKDILAETVEKVKSAAPPAPKAKLTEDEKLFMIGMIAQCYSDAEIAEEMYRNFGKNVSPTLIWVYKHTKKWFPVIQKIREEYCIDVPASPMAQKKVRLERLDRIYNRAVAKDDLSYQLGAVRQGQVEMTDKKDGDMNITFNNPTFNQLTLLTNEELLERQKEATKKLMQKQEQKEESNGPGGTAEG